MSGWIISLVVLVVAICAGLAALGFRGRITTVGIDLGTTFSVVGINKDGKVIIIPNKDNKLIFPSIVSYQDNGEILVAYEALAKANQFPQNTIYNAKRFIGRSLDEEDVQKYADEHPFKVIPSTKSNYSKVGFEITASGHPSIITPEEVGTQVLKYLLKITADYLGHTQVNKAVLAVPAKFNAIQRQATAAAFAAANLKVVRVIEEPTAAAVAYKLHKKSTVHHILVYDFGGGTLDVSILFVSKGSVQVYATDGDDNLGGSDFDLCLFKHLRHKVEEIVQTTLPNTEVHEMYANEVKPCTLPQLHTLAEDIKKQLTYANSTLFQCYHEASEKVVSFNVERTIDFEEQCDYLFQRAITPVDRLLNELEMSKSTIDEVVLVGGSTRVPRVKVLLSQYFDNKALNDHIDPDITVAYGAASIMD